MVCYGVEGVRKTEQDTDPTEKDHVHEHANPKSSERGSTTGRVRQELQP